jgi:uncharacterized alkaline shock family protein YloU
MRSKQSSFYFSQKVIAQPIISGCAIAFFGIGKIFKKIYDGLKALLVRDKKILM